MHGKNLISDADFSRRYNNLKNEQQNINIQIHELENNNGNLNDFLDSSMKLLKNLTDYYENSIPEVKNDLLSLLFPEGFFYSDEKVGTTKIATIFKVFECNNTEKSTLVREGGFEPPQVLPH